MKGQILFFIICALQAVAVWGTFGMNSQSFVAASVILVLFLELRGIQLALREKNG